MPQGDRTGPRGAGPMTGRARGFCAGMERPGYADHEGPFGGAGRFGRHFGRGHGFGRGFGPGYGRGFHRGYGRDWPGAADVPADTADLAAEIERLRERLHDLERRLADQGPADAD